MIKVDDEGKGCGNYGELLYESKQYQDRISPSFRYAIDKGFDPIKAIMKTCKGVYGKEKINFHAWFPVFKDPMIIKDLKDKGINAGAQAKKDTLAFWENNPIYYSSRFVNPESLEAVDYEIEILKEIVAGYKIDGINLDYIRYPGGDDPNKTTGYNWIINPDAVTDFVKKVRERVRKYNLILSADVFPSEADRKKLGQDGILVHLDLVLPMEYTTLTVGTSPEITDSLDHIKVLTPNLPIIPILRGWAHNEDAYMFINSIKADTLAAKKSGIDIVGVFTYEVALENSESKSLKKLGQKIGEVKME